MVDQILTATDQADVTVAAKRVEAEEMGKERTRGITNSATNAPAEHEKTRN